MEITGRIAKSLTVKDVETKSGHKKKMIRFGIKKEKWYNFTIFAESQPDYIKAGREVTVSFEEEDYNADYDNYTVDISMVRANGDEKTGSATNHEVAPPDPEMEIDYAETKVSVLRAHIKMLKEEFDDEKASQIMSSPTGGSLINNIWR